MKMRHRKKEFESEAIHRRAVLDHTQASSRSKWREQKRRVRVVYTKQRRKIERRKAEEVERGSKGVAKAITLQ